MYTTLFSAARFLFTLRHVPTKPKNLFQWPLSRPVRVVLADNGNLGESNEIVGIDCSPKISILEDRAQLSLAVNEQPDGRTGHFGRFCAIRIGIALFIK